MSKIQDFIDALLDAHEGKYGWALTDDDIVENIDLDFDGAEPQVWYSVLRFTKGELAQTYTCNVSF